MMMRRAVRMGDIGCTVLAALALAAVAAACSGGDRPAITVFAAASLAGAMQPLADDYGAANGVDVRLSYGGSTALAQHLLRGAPADVFISAGAAPMDAVDGAGLLSPGSRTDLAGNALVLVAPRGAALASPGDLLDAAVRRVALADPALAPAGAYAREALIALGLWDALQPKLVYGPDVRTALQYATSGVADAAVVYATDVAGVDSVSVVWRVPSESHAPVRYPAAALAGARNPEGAAAFLAYLRGDAAQEALRLHGFTPP